MDKFKVVARGAGRSFDLFGSGYRARDKMIAPKFVKLSDAEQIRRDWCVVGKDLYSGIKIVKKEML